MLVYHMYYSSLLIHFTTAGECDAILIWEIRRFLEQCMEDIWGRLTVYERESTDLLPGIAELARISKSQRAV